MRLLNIFIILISSIVFISCKTMSSDTSELVLKEDGSYMLLGVANANEAMVVCGFECSEDVHDKVDKKNYCTYPRYIKISDIPENSSLKVWLNAELIQAKDEIYAIDISYEEMREFKQMFSSVDEDVGAPKKVCEPILYSDRNFKVLTFFVKQQLIPEDEMFTTEQAFSRGLKSIDDYEGYDTSDFLSDVSNKFVTIYYDENGKEKSRQAFKGLVLFDSKTKKYWEIKRHKGGYKKVKSLNEANSWCGNKAWKVPTASEVYTLNKHGFRKYDENRNWVLTRSTVKKNVLEQDVYFGVVDPSFGYSTNTDRLDDKEYVVFCVKK